MLEFLNGPRRDRTCDPLIKSPARVLTATKTHRQLPRSSRGLRVRSWLLSAGVGACSRTEHGQSLAPSLEVEEAAVFVKLRPADPGRSTLLNGSRAAPHCGHLRASARQGPDRVRWSPPRSGPARCSSRHLGAPSAGAPRAPDSTRASHAWTAAWVRRSAPDAVRGDKGGVPLRQRQIGPVREGDGLPRC